MSFVDLDRFTRINDTSVTTPVTTSSCRSGGVSPP
jgi:hypothetical protein